MIVAAFDLLSQQWIFEVNELFVPNTSTVIWGLVMQGFAVCRLHSKQDLIVGACPPVTSWMTHGWNE
jgi:hypothetical protein